MSLIRSRVDVELRVYLCLYPRIGLRLEHFISPSWSRRMREGSFAEHSNMELRFTWKDAQPLVLGIWNEA